MRFGIKLKLPECDVSCVDVNLVLDPIDVILLLLHRVSGLGLRDSNNSSNRYSKDNSSNSNNRKQSVRLKEQISSKYNNSNS